MKIAYLAVSYNSKQTAIMLPIHAAVLMMKRSSTKIISQTIPLLGYMATVRLQLVFTM
jgi:hypothetical protein